MFRLFWTRRSSRVIIKNKVLCTPVFWPVVIDVPWFKPPPLFQPKRERAKIHLLIFPCYQSLKAYSFTGVLLSEKKLFLRPYCCCTQLSKLFVTPNRDYDLFIFKCHKWNAPSTLSLQYLTNHVLFKCAGIHHGK